MNGSVQFNPDQVAIIQDGKVVAVYNTKTELILATGPEHIPIKLNHYRQKINPKFNFVICIETD